jgi:acyl-CoA thioester hydrolase
VGRAGVITFRGVVYPAQCDAMGHMNVQHYTAAFDQAMWHLVAQLGFRPSAVAEQRVGWADVRYLINFRRELRAGELYHAESSVVKVGNSSLVTRHRIIDTEAGEIAAEVEMTSVHFDLEKRTSRALPAEIRAAAERLLVGPPESLPVLRAGSSRGVDAGPGDGESLRTP